MQPGLCLVCLKNIREPGWSFARPCEMRALTEMTKHASFKIDNLLTISVDCLGTLPADEYQWRLGGRQNTPWRSGNSSRVV